MYIYIYNVHIDYQGLERAVSVARLKGKGPHKRSVFVRRHW